MIDVTKAVSMFSLWVSTKCQWFLVLHIPQSKSSIVSFFQRYVLVGIIAYKANASVIAPS